MFCLSAVEAGCLMIVYIDQWCQFSCQQPLLIMWSLCNERHANSWIIGIALSFRQTKLREADWINYVHLQDDSIDLLQYYKTHPDPWNGHSHEVISTDVQTSSQWKWPSHIACFNSHTFFLSLIRCWSAPFDVTCCWIKLLSWLYLRAFYRVAIWKWCIIKHYD